MTKTRNLSDLLDANGDVKLGNLDNVPASNDASALTTGTLPIARIADGDIALAKLSATGTKDATTFLRGDNTFDTPPLGGITGADQWRLTSGFTGGVNPIASNLERNDTYFSKIGTGLSQSSGIFTFPDTGIWQITFNYNARNNGDDRVVTGYIAATTDNSSYANIAYGDGFIQQTGGSTTYISSGSSAIFDVTNTTTHKVRFQIAMVNSSTLIIGDSATNTTYFTFIRLGDT